MWFWLRKNIHEGNFSTFLAASALIHVLFLAWFFFGFKDRSSQLAFMVTPAMLNNKIEFVFGPVKNSAKPGTKNTRAAVQKNNTKTKSAPAKKLDMKTSIAQKKSQKPVAKKVETKKKIAKPIEKKIEEKKTPESEKPKPEIKKEPEKKIEEVKTPINSDPIALSTNDSETIQQQQIGIHERGLIDEYIAFQKDIVAQWAPPPGVAHDCMCLVTVMVDWQGAVKDITIEKSSGVLVYDASARAALAKLTMPRWAWGKSITITFNQ